MRAISVEELKQKSIEENEIEIVERKGRGHPDYIADGASEAVSRALCRYYKEEFGLILHHNVDKGLVVGGMAHPVFGGGEVTEPICVIIAGRAVTEVLKGGRKVQVPVESLAKSAIREFLKKNFRFLDADRHVNAQAMIRQGSVDLVKVFDEGEKMPLANDTSFGIGFAPLSETENLVFETEQYLNSPEVKKKVPELGEDIKVMGLRCKDGIRLTVACPMISSLTPDLSHYLNLKDEVKNRIADLAAKKTSREVGVVVNTADKPEKGIFYITVTGTSAERGDDGNTGRGNRINGLITPCRPMSLEATGGKNPVNHVGKIYNVLARVIADRAYNEVKGIREVHVKILSQIGKPIDNPAMTDIQAIMEPGYSLSNAKSELYALADKEISDVRGITDLILEDKVLLF